MRVLGSIESGLSGRVVRLMDGSDPDSYVISKDGTQRLIDDAPVFSAALKMLCGDGTVPGLPGSSN